MSSDLHKGGKETEPKKPSEQILRQEIHEGLSALKLPLGPLFISGLSAGLEVSFSLFLMAVVQTLVRGKWDVPARTLLTANMYAVGFIFVVLGRSELFTEQTTLAVLPVLNRRASLASLLRLWVVVYVANLIGAAAFAWLAVLVGPALGVADHEAFGTIARQVVDHGGPAIFGSAVLAGWLMGLMSWLVAASRDTVGQLLVVWLVAFVIGLARLHHVVVGSAEVLAGLFDGAEGVTAAGYGWFLLWATLGNILGGSFFVALIKSSYAVRGRRRE